LRKKILLLSIFLILLSFLSILTGPVKTLEKTIIFDIRIPRILVVIFSGSLLSIAGLFSQTLFRNPIAEPYLLGISAGAALGAFIAKNFIPLFPYSIQIFAFIFSQVIVLIVIFISLRNGFLPRETLLLSGIALSLLSSGILSFLIFLSPSERIKIFFWLFGSFSLVSWNEFFIILSIFIFSLIFIFLNIKKYDLMLLSDEEAISMGIDIKKERIILSIFISLLTGAVVSIAGIIGFVGLIVPHIARMMAKSGKHKNLVIYTAFTGSILLLICDDLSRTLFGGAEIPVGVFTSLLGVPFFLYLLIKRREGIF